MFDRIIQKVTKAAKTAVQTEVKKGVGNGVNTGIKIATYAAVGLIYLVQRKPTALQIKKSNIPATVVYNYYFIGKEMLKG